VRARHDARYLSWRWDADVSLVGSFRLPPEQAAVLLEALEAARVELPFAVADAPSSITAEPGVGWQFDRALIDAFADRYAAETEPDTPAEVRPADPTDASAEASSPRSVDALVRVATSYLDTKLESSTPNRREGYQLVLYATTQQVARDHDEAADGITTSEGVRLHPETARRLSCDCPISTLTDDVHGSPLHLGRRIRGRVARAVHYRDHGRCQAPGCTAAATITHHIRHWARGGTTCLINLISLCDGHHWLVHDGGWTIAVIRHGRRLDTNRTPNAAGQPLPTDPTIEPDAVTGHWTGDSLDIGYATSVLNATKPAQRRPEGGRGRRAAARQ
jgi:hypothetical protein